MRVHRFLNFQLHNIILYCIIKYILVGGVRTIYINIVRVRVAEDLGPTNFSVPILISYIFFRKRLVARSARTPPAPVDRISSARVR